MTVAEIRERIGNFSKVTIALQADRIGLRLGRALVAIEESAETHPVRAVLAPAAKEDPAMAKAQLDLRMLLAFSDRI